MSDTNISTATAAPTEVELNGKTYLAGRLRLQDYGYLEQWMRDCLVKSGREAMKDPELNKEDKQIILRQAYEAGAGITFSKPSTCEGFISSVAGGLRICWLSLRHHNTMPPDQHKITLDETAEIVTQLEKLKEITDIAIEEAEQLETATEEAQEEDGKDTSDPTQSSISIDSSPPNTDGQSQ